VIALAPSFARLHGAGLRLLLVGAAAGMAVAPLAFAPAVQAASGKAATPIDHVVMLMQENHTFDNYFSEFPGVEQPPSSVCMPDWIAEPAIPGKTSAPTGSPGVPAPSSGPTATPIPVANHTPVPSSVPSATQCFPRFHLSSHRTVDLNHGAPAALRAYDGGKMDGFSSAQAQYGLPLNLTVGYYDGADLPLYYNLASQYVLAQHFFSSAWGSSEINHMYAVAARGGGPLPATGYTFPTIFDELEAAGVSWKFYVQNYDPTVNFLHVDKTTDKASQLIWAPLLNFQRFVDGTPLSSHIVDLSQYWTDLEHGTLPQVAYIAPSGLSEHPPGDITVGQSFAVSAVTSLMRSSAWDSSLFVLTWDDWGGWYDHVLPPQIDGDGYGFRVPALFVSPYAKAGTIDNTTYDFTSILRFVEDNWSLPPLTGRDATANSVANALDFGRPPAPAVFPAQTWNPTPVQDGFNRPLVLLAIYAATLSVALVGGFYLLLHAGRRRGIKPEARHGLDR
jgi:phospholipase C